jgi:hypothetical protein
MIAARVRYDSKTLRLRLDAFERASAAGVCVGEFWRRNAHGLDVLVMARRRALTAIEKIPDGEKWVDG